MLLPRNEGRQSPVSKGWFSSLAWHLDFLAAFGKRIVLLLNAMALYIFLKSVLHKIKSIFRRQIAVLRKTILFQGDIGIFNKIKSL